MIHNHLKLTSLLLAPRSWMVRSLHWRLSQPGFDPSYGKLICLATLMTSDRTKQICLWMTVCIYMSYSSSYLTFSLSVSLESKRCIHTVLLTRQQFRRIPVLSYLRTNFYKVNNLSMTLYILLIRISTNFSVIELLLPWYINYAINFKVQPFK